MDESCGLGFWETLNDQDLLSVINSPHAYRSSERAFAAQEYATRLLKENESNINGEDYCSTRSSYILPKVVN
jgi:hypothetical protein